MRVINTKFKKCLLKYVVEVIKITNIQTYRYTDDERDYGHIAAEYQMSLLQMLMLMFTKA